MTELLLDQDEVATTSNPKQILMDLVHYRTYAATLASGRKESRTEVIDRVKQMHQTKFP